MCVMRLGRIRNGAEPRAAAATAAAADSRAARPEMEHRHTNGDEGGRSSSGSEAEDEGAEELSLHDAGAPARALAALNALRKSRQHYDVVLVAGGAEIPAHRAVLAAASPYLLHALHAAPAPALYRVEGASSDAVRALVEYAYSGRLAVPDLPAARALYRAAWRLRVEPARAHLAERLLRRLHPHAALAARALPGLAGPHLAELDAYIADNFEEVCESGALATLPQINIEMMRESSSADGGEAAAAVADAALAWLRARADVDLDELCARTHLLYVDARGELQDCGQLPPASGDAPELQLYRREAQARRRLPPAAEPAPRALPGLELGERTPRAECAVLAARRTPGGSTRALLALRGRLAGVRVAWSDVAAGGGGVARGGALGGEASDGERRARMAESRAAHGAAALGGRLLVCGGYDRARVLRSAETYDPATNTWAAAADMRGPRARFQAARLGECVWALGGSDGQAELDSVDVFEHGRWRAGARLPLALSHAAVAADAAGGALYVVGGWAGGATLRRVLRYSCADQCWAEAAPLGAGRAQCGAVWWDGALWALGGCDAWHCLAGTERLGAEGWAPGPALPTARRSVGACAWRGALLAAGGSDGAASLRRTELLAPGAAGWRAGPALRRARASLALVALGRALYAVGGFDGKEFLACVESLHEPDGEWTALCDPPPVPRPTCLPAEEQSGASSPVPSPACKATRDSPPERPQVTENGSPQEAQ